VQSISFSRGMVQVRPAVHNVAIAHAHVTAAAHAVGRATQP
jgi:hypothetical protein